MIKYSHILTLIFITLKLTNHISWSWVWILAPSWIGLIVGLGLFLVALATLALMRALE